MRIFSWLPVVALLVTACKSIEPTVPQNSVKPIPPLVPEVSNVSIPIEIDLKTYLNDAEKSLPKSFSGKNEQCEGLSTSYYFTREKINFKGSGNAMSYSVNGALKLKLNYCPKCQYLLDEKGSCVIPRVYLSCGDDEPMRRFTLDYSTNIKVGSDYTFNTSTSLKKFQLLDPCQMTIANIDVTSDVEKEIKKQLVGLQSEIDKQFKAIDIKSSAKEAWDLLQDPNLVPGYGYLNLNPSSLALSDIKLVDKKATLGLSIDISPSFTTEKPVVNKLSLPILGSSTKSSGLNFGLDVVLSYDSLTSFVRQSFVGQIFEVKRKKIKVDDIQVSGSKDNRIVLKTTISGSKKGTIYLLAQPVLNDSLKRMELRNVDFDVETKSLLMKSAKWFFNSKIIDLIEKNGNFDYTSMVEDMKTEVNNSLNQEISKGVKMNGAINSIELKQLYYTTSHLVLRARLSGNLKLILE
jgi:hypothetical protein